MRALLDGFAGIDGSASAKGDYAVGSEGAGLGHCRLYGFDNGLFGTGKILDPQALCGQIIHQPFCPRGTGTVNNEYR